MLGSRRFDNRGSEARDHLANERTLLAWVRTALGVMGLGVIVDRFVESAGAAAEVVGLSLVALGAVMVIYAVVRFEKVGAMLAEGHYQTSLLGPLLVGVAGLVTCVGAMVLILIAG